MSFRKITKDTINNKQKDLLRRYYNIKNGTTYRDISGIANKMRVSSQEAYENIKSQFNTDIDKARRFREKQRKSQSGKKYYEENVRVVNRNDDLYHILRDMLGKSLVITTLKEKGGDIFRTSHETIPDTIKGFSDWWKKTGMWIVLIESQIPIYNEYPDAVIYIYEAIKKINTTKIKQYFKEGSVNCLLKPILKWANECKENAKSARSVSRYKTIINRINNIAFEIGDNGVSEAEMARISQEAQVDISIEKPIIVGEEKYVTETKSSKKALKHFILRNTQINHVEQNELLYLNNIEIVSRDKLYSIKSELDQNGIYSEFSRDLNGIISINTLEKTWKLSNEFMELINAMEQETGLIDCYIDDIDNAELSKYILYGTHYNATVDFDMTYNNVNHMDMKTAYANYRNCEYYEGFLGKITDFRETDRIEGVGLYQIYDLVLSPIVKKYNDKLKIYFDNNIYPSPELQWLLRNGCSFKISYGCWGALEHHFNMHNYPFLFKKYDKVKGYAKYVGMCDSHYLTKKFSCYGTEELASTLDNCKWYKNNEITISYPKKHNYHMGHFTAFILAYQRLQVLDQLLTMNYDNLVRVCVDGIYYRGNEVLRKGFEPKSKMAFGNVAGDSYVSNIITDVVQEWNCGEYKPNNSRELYIGEGGNGKTHKNLMDKGLVKVLYIAPSWKLAEKKRQEYGCDSEVWANILSKDPEKINSIKRRYNVFIIDEVSMMTQENKLDIFEKFENIKLIFCGDIGFQAPPFTLSNGIPVEEMDSSGFDVIYEEKINHRYKCPILKDIIASIRLMIYHDRPNVEVNAFIKSMFPRITDLELKDRYSVEDMILSRSHIVKDTYTDMFKDIPKWYVTTNTRQYKNGQIIIGDKPNTTCELRHAYTIHSIQGETAEKKLFINMSKCYDKRLLYTAISRARRAEQIILLY